MGYLKVWERRFRLNGGLSGLGSVQYKDSGLSGLGNGVVIWEVVGIWDELVLGWLGFEIE